MEKENPYQHLEGRVCITPYEETAGLMLVNRVYRHDGEWMADGLFIGDHSAGYKDGSIACYHASGLRPTALVDTDGADLFEKVPLAM